MVPILYSLSLYKTLNIRVYNNLEIISRVSQKGAENHDLVAILDTELKMLSELGVNATMGFLLGRPGPDFWLP